jgi:hypothetical protein
MKKLLLGLAALPLLAGVALAAEPLKDAQLDKVTAGGLLPTLTINCPGCVSASSGQTSMTLNGLTSGTTGTGSGTTGTGSGTTGTGSGTTGTGSGTTGGIVVTLQPNLLAAIIRIGGFDPTNP